MKKVLFKFDSNFLPHYCKPTNWSQYGCGLCGFHLSVSVFTDSFSPSPLSSSTSSDTFWRLLSCYKRSSKLVRHVNGRECTDLGIIWLHIGWYIIIVQYTFRKLDRHWTYQLTTYQFFNAGICGTFNNHRKLMKTIAYCTRRAPSPPRPKKKKDEKILGESLSKVVDIQSASQLKPAAYYKFYRISWIWKTSFQSIVLADNTYSTHDLHVPNLNNYAWIYKIIWYKITYFANITAWRRLSTTLTRFVFTIFCVLSFHRATKKYNVCFNH